MAILTAVLAFAITMLMLSMVNSVLVETIHRFRGMREKGLQLLMRHAYERIMAPYLRTQGLDETRLETLRTEFIDLMTVNRAPAGVMNAKLGSDAAKLGDDSHVIDSGLLSRIWSGRRLARLGAEDFMSRLGGSDFGGYIRGAISSAGADADQVLKDIAERFQQFGRESSVFFERRARLVSVLCAIALAVIMHVHPLDLYRTYLTNPAVAEAVIKLQDETLSVYETRLSEAEAQLKQASDRGDQQTATTIENSIATLRTEIEATTEKLQSLGVPIGWTTERFAAAGIAKGWMPEAGKRGVFAATIAWLVLGGLLVGLGSPFWYDMVKSVSAIRNLVGGPKSAANTGAPPGESETAATKQPVTPVEHFHTAAAGYDAQNADTADEEPAVG